MDARTLQCMAAGIVLTGAVAYAAAAEPVMSPGSPAPQGETKKQESARPPVQPVPAESRTPEEAAKRAADPKDPSGALIIAPPVAEKLKADR